MHPPQPERNSNPSYHRAHHPVPARTHQPRRATTAATSTTRNLGKQHRRNGSTRHAHPLERSNPRTNRGASPHRRVLPSLRNTLRKHNQRWGNQTAERDHHQHPHRNSLMPPLPHLMGRDGDVGAAKTSRSTKKAGSIMRLDLWKKYNPHRIDIMGAPMSPSQISPRIDGAFVYKYGCWCKYCDWKSCWYGTWKEAMRAALQHWKEAILFQWPTKKELHVLDTAGIFATPESTNVNNDAISLECQQCGWGKLTVYGALLEPKIYGANLYGEIISSHLWVRHREELNLPPV